MKIDTPLIVIIINYILLGFATIYRDGSNLRHNFSKLLLAIIFLGTFYLIFALLFIAWYSPYPTKMYIDGVQPRYLLPIAPLLFILFNNKYIYIKNNDKAFSLLCIIIVSLSLSISLATLIGAYYI